MTVKLLKARLRETASAIAPSFIELTSVNEQGRMKAPKEHPVVQSYMLIMSLRDALDKLTPEQVEVIERNF